jgi:hypothetical protein
MIGLASALAAPAVMRAESLMPVREPLVMFGGKIMPVSQVDIDVLIMRATMARLAEKCGRPLRPPMKEARALIAEHMLLRERVEAERLRRRRECCVRCADLVQDYLDSNSKRWDLEPFQMRRYAAVLREPDPHLRMSERLRRDRLIKQLELVVEHGGLMPEVHRLKAARLRKLLPREPQRFRAKLLAEAAKHERRAGLLERGLSRIRSS